MYEMKSISRNTHGLESVDDACLKHTVIGFGNVHEDGECREAADTVVLDVAQQVQNTVLGAQPWAKSRHTRGPSSSLLKVPREACLHCYNMVSPWVAKIIIAAIGSSMWIWMQTYVKVQVALHGQSILIPKNRTEPPDLTNDTYGRHAYSNLTNITMHYVTKGCEDVQGRPSYASDATWILGFLVHLEQTDSYAWGAILMLS
ncbi:hypothetical protein MTO96_040507 [Rhipicephalus appendiculatus]